VDLGPNQACTLYGSEPGNPIVSGAAYIREGWQMNVHDLWVRCFLVLLLFLVFFLVAQVVALEYYVLPPGPPGGLSIYAKDTAETKKRNAELQVRREEKAKAKDLADKASSSSAELKAVDKNAYTEEKGGVHRKAFTWEHLDYDVPVPGGTRRILSDVHGYVKPGTLTALMGASGAGKTTCLDVLAQRKNIGVISGDLLVDGRPINSDFQRGTGYAEQMDVHEGKLLILLICVTNCLLMRLV
jgi:ATP-binding cassette, subfamily G (WHITE), member 2, SNQ2